VEHTDPSALCVSSYTLFGSCEPASTPTGGVTRNHIHHVPKPTQMYQYSWMRRFTFVARPRVFQRIPIDVVTTKSGSSTSHSVSAV
jgi:hypothetical protein